MIRSKLRRYADRLALRLGYQPTRHIVVNLDVDSSELTEAIARHFHRGAARA